MHSQILTADRHYVDIANRSSTALELLSVNDYDVILSDLRMHEMDDEDFYKALQQDQCNLVLRVSRDNLATQTETRILQ
jgi:DNA-binding NtrC family response regulator